jgi:hypothetical protein
MSILRSPGRLAAIAIVVAIGIIGAAWLLPPLGTGSAGVASGPPGSDQGTDPAEAAAQIKFIPSGRVAFGVEVRNITFVPVTIDGLDEGRTSVALKDVHLVLGEGPIMGLDEAQTRAFEPISLAPGESRLIGVVGYFPDCADARPNWATGTGATIVSLLLEVRIAGILPTAAEVALIQAVDLLGNADEACPRP